MVRILAFTDPHHEHAAALAIVDRATRAKPDLVLCAGDISFFGEGHEPFLRQLSVLGREIYFVPGNHDSGGLWRRTLERFAFMRDLSFELVEAGGVRLTGIPGSEPYWPGGGEDASARDRVLRACDPPDRSKPLVLVTHYPPWKTKLSGLDHVTPDSGGSMTVRRIVEALQPALVVCGHYHQDFRKTDAMGAVRLVNPGPYGMIVDV